MSGKGTPPHRAKGPPSTVKDAKRTPSVSSKSKLEKKQSEEKRTSVDLKHKTETVAPVAQLSADKKKTRVAKCAGDRDAQDPGAILRLTLDKLKIKTAHKSESARKVNEIIDRIMNHMKKQTECFKEVGDLRTGSYYENLKVGRPTHYTKRWLS